MTNTVGPGPLPAGIRNGSIEHKPIPATTSTQFLGPSPNRVALILSPQTGTNLCLNNRPISGLNDGFQYAATQTPIYLTQTDHGDIIKKPWFTFGTLAFEMSWLEVLEG